MNFFRRMLCLLLSLTCLLGVMVLPASTAAATASATGDAGDTTGTYARKVVSVLFDNSFSMNNSVDLRNEYAMYALKMLVAMLGEEDTLVITPMNKSQTAAVDDISYGYEVDLADPDRNTQIEVELAKFFQINSPKGQTPFSSVDIALQQLTARGMKEQSNSVVESTDNTEYWLFVVSDGDFTSQTHSNVEATYYDYASSYANFHLVSLGVIATTADYSNPGEPLASAGNYKGYFAADSDGIVETMQAVANQISGRYTAPADLYTVNGKQVTVHLDKLGFAVRNLSIILQNSSAELESAVYKNTDLLIKRPCAIDSGYALSNILGDGYSAVVEQASGTMSGGEIVLTFSDTVNEFSLMVEPALKLRAIVERLDGANWVAADRQYINGNMKPGDQVRVDYEVREEGSNRVIILSDLFDDVTERVTYAGNTYRPGDTIPLALGNNDITISVSARGGAYTLYDSFNCIVEANPSDFRIEVEAISTDGNAGKKYNLQYTVYDHDAALSASELASYTWQITGKDARGNDIALNPTVDADAKINVPVDLSTLPVGISQFTARVVSPDGFSREKSYSFTVNPNLALAVTVERQEDGAWVATDRQYINSQMRPGDEVRATYTVTDLDTGNTVNVADLFGIAVNETVTYAGRTYQPGDPIPLAVGRQDITVTVSTVDGSYTLSGTFNCVVEADPNDFRVEGKAESTDGGFGVLYDIIFTAYVNGNQVSFNDLQAWSVTGEDNNGNAIALHPTVGADGRILLSVDLSQLPYGAVNFYATVTSADGFTRETTVSLVHAPKSIFATVNGQSVLTKTKNQLKHNQDGFSFSAMVEGDNTPLNLSACDYSVIINGVDVTAYCTVVDGTIVLFVPNGDSLGSLADRIGDMDVQFKVAIKGHPEVSATAGAKLTVTPTVYEIVSSIRGGTVHPFVINDSDTEIMFSVIRDGIVLSAEELQAAYESGELTVTVEGRNFLEKGLGSFKIECVTVEDNGTPVLKLMPASRHFSLLACFTGMFVFPGDRTAVAACGGVTAEEGFSVLNPGAWAYIWRLLVLFLILHIIMLIVGFKSITRFERGRYAHLSVTLKKDKITWSSVDVTEIGHNFFARILWRRLLIPCVYWFRGTQELQIESDVKLRASTMFPEAEIARSDETETGFTASMTNLFKDFETIEAMVRADEVDEDAIEKMHLDFKVRMSLFPPKEDEETEKNDMSWVGGLSGLSSPLCINHQGNQYDFIFFVPYEQ